MLPKKEKWKAKRKEVLQRKMSLFLISNQFRTHCSFIYEIGRRGKKYKKKRFILCHWPKSAISLTTHSTSSLGVRLRRPQTNVRVFFTRCVSVYGRNLLNPVCDGKTNRNKQTWNRTRYSCFPWNRNGRKSWWSPPSQWPTGNAAVVRRNFVPSSRRVRRGRRTWRRNAGRRRWRRVHGRFDEMCRQTKTGLKKRQ